MRRKRADFHQSLGARNDAPIQSRIYHCSPDSLIRRFTMIAHGPGPYNFNR